MIEKKRINAMIRDHKTVLIIIAIALFLIELEIFAVAAIKSGKKSQLQVYDKQGNLIYETDGDSLSDFNKYYFEKTFGPFESYDVKRVSNDEPFPFRAWFVAAVGIPIGIVLLFAFVVRAFTALFYGDKAPSDVRDASASEHGTRLERAAASVGRLNIFTIGSLVFLAVIAYWIIPNLIGHLGKIGMETVIRFKWLFLSAGGVGTAILVWVIYLRYLLAKRGMDLQADLDKYRLELEYRQNVERPLSIAYDSDGSHGNQKLIPQGSKPMEPMEPPINDAEKSTS